MVDVAVAVDAAAKDAGVVAEVQATTLAHDMTATMIIRVISSWAGRRKQMLGGLRA